MGLGPASVRLNLELYQRGILKNVKSVVETGSQELHMRKDDFEQLIKSYGVPNYDGRKFEPWKFPERPRCSAKPFYQLLGAEKYTCIDLTGEHGAIQLDLNRPLEDKSYWGQYDLVTDHGCNEHAFNVTESYRTMHRLCKVGGILEICKAAWNGNGYFLFDKGFFESMAAANNYKILFSSYSVTLNDNQNPFFRSQYHVPLAHNLLYALDNSKLQDIGICYVMQKQSSEDFKYAYELPYYMTGDGHFGYEVMFHVDPPARSYIPMASLEQFRIRDLVTQAGKKLRRKIFKK